MRILKVGLIGALASAAVLVLCATATASPGDYDPAFGKKGIATNPAMSGAVIEDVELRSDGSMLVAATHPPYGPDHLVSLRSDGKLDASYGNGGVGELNGPRQVVGPFAIASDGSAFVEVHSYPQDAQETTTSRIIRLLPSGERDQGFAGDGELEVDPYVEAIAIDQEGRILTETGGGVARFHADGSPDASFGVGGVAPTPNGLAARDLFFDDLGRITVAGEDVTGAPGLTRLLPGGEVDPAFGDAGYVNLGFGALYAGGTSVEDGSIFVALSDCSIGTCTYLTTRYTADGQLDGPRDYADTASEIDADSRGRLILAPPVLYNYAGLPVNDVLFRVGPTGKRDKSFGIEGAHPLFAGKEALDARDIELAADERTAVIGTREGVVARILLHRGKDDADADVRSDSSDRCPFIRGRREGCPLMGWRRVRLSREIGKRITLQVTADKHVCNRRVPVVIRMRGRSEKVLARGITDTSGRFRPPIRPSPRARLLGVARAVERHGYGICRQARVTSR